MVSHKLMKANTKEIESSHQVQEEVHGLVLVRRVCVEPPLSHDRAAGLVEDNDVNPAASILVPVL